MVIIIIRKKERWHIRRKIGPYYVSAVSLVCWIPNLPFLKNIGFRTIFDLPEMGGHYELMVFYEGKEKTQIRMKYRSQIEKIFWSTVEFLQFCLKNKKIIGKDFSKFEF